MSFKSFLKREQLNEGGAFGHLDNVFDNRSFTFKDLKDIISDSLSGNLEYVKLKTDGQNLMFTWKDGEMRMARNKTDLKNFGENAMTAGQLANKFKGRGGLEFAYNNAVIDLTKALSKLTEKQRQKIFKNGKKFMSIEVMHVDSENVVHYGSNQIRFHGTREYDVEGNAIGEEKKDADILAGMIRQVQAEKQDTFTISNLQNVALPKVPNFSQQVSSFTNQLSKIQKKYKLNDANTIGDYMEAFFQEKLGDIKNERLLRRLAHQDKSYKATDMKKDFEGAELEKVKEIDKNSAKLGKEAQLPLEYLILRLGATVLSNVKEFMVLNPDKSTRKVKDDLDKAVSAIEKSGKTELLPKLKLELERLKQAGGVDAVFPEEGITFIWKDNFMKLTGTFAPVNQIMGLLWRI